MPGQRIRIGTRGSPLALAQAHEVRARLMAAHGLAEAAFEIRVIKTTGDRIQDRPLSEAGGKGLFTKEIEEALFAGDIDLGVHSMKDMQTVLPDGLGIGAVLQREDVRDAFISFKYGSLSEMPKGAIVGTSSLAPSRAGEASAPRSRGRGLSRQRRDATEEAGTGRGGRDVSRVRGAQPSGPRASHHGAGAGREHVAGGGAGRGGARNSHRRHQDGQARCARSITSRRRSPSRPSARSWRGSKAHAARLSPGLRRSRSGTIELSRRIAVAGWQALSRQPNGAARCARPPSLGRMRPAKFFPAAPASCWPD